MKQIDIHWLSDGRPDNHGDYELEFEYEEEEGDILTEEEQAAYLIMTPLERREWFTEKFPPPPGRKYVPLRGWDAPDVGSSWNPWVDVDAVTGEITKSTTLN